LEKQQTPLSKHWKNRALSIGYWLSAIDHALIAQPLPRVETAHHERYLPLEDSKIMVLGSRK
jgi:hypothetical protein